ncbi:MAG: HAD family phosphatase [Candidatus Sabulitectum sp.]|nr:HAD family phosphatase [Candidatus Sabulitectum sp.]
MRVEGKCFECRSVLFDMDGVLVNTEPLKGLAHVLAVRSLGGDASLGLYKRWMGRPRQEVANNYIEHSNVHADLDEYDQLFQEKYFYLLKNHLVSTRNVSKLLTDLHQLNIRIALVSSSRKWMIDYILSKLSLGDMFDSIVSSDDVTSEKPDPEPYRIALKQLGIKPANGLAIEDSESGVTAATQAGLAVIAIRHDFNTQQNLSNAIVEFEYIPALQEILHCFNGGML